MQKGVGKLLLEVLFVQKLLDPRVDHGVLQNLVDVGPLGRVQIEQGSDKIVRLLAEMRRYVGIFALQDLFGELVKGLRVERRMQGTHLEE